MNLRYGKLKQSKYCDVCGLKFNSTMQTIQYYILSYDDLKINLPEFKVCDGCNNYAYYYFIIESNLLNDLLYKIYSIHTNSNDDRSIINNNAIIGMFNKYLFNITLNYNDIDINNNNYFITQQNYKNITYREYLALSKFLNGTKND